MPRSILRVAPLAAPALLLVACGASPLVPGRWLDQNIDGASPRAYRVAVPTGAAARVLVDQQAADLAIDVRPPGGAATTIDARERGLESVTLAPDAGGTFVVTVRAVGRDQARTGFRVRLDGAPHAATDRDRQWQTGERAETEGRRLLLEGPSRSSEAFARFANALEIWRALNEAPAVAQVLTGIGDIHYARAEFEQAAAAYTEALALSRSLRLDYQAALIENNLGVGQGQRGLLDEARSHFAAARALWPTLPGTDLEAAATLSNEGAMFAGYGSYQEALERFQAVLRLLEHAPNRENVPGVMINIAFAYRALGDLDAAQQFLERSLPLFVLPRFAGPKAKAQLRLAEVALERGDVRTAESAVREALPAARDGHDPLLEAHALDLLGQVAARGGRPDEALASYTQALDLYRRADARRGVAAARHHIGLAARALGRTVEARAALTEALALRHDAGFRDEEAETQYELALLEQDGGALSVARSHLGAALDLIEGVRGRVFGEYSRTTYFASRQKYFTAAIDVLMQLHAQHPSGGFAAQAFDMSERARARALLDALWASGTSLRRGVSPALLEEERAAQQQVDFWSNRLARLAGQKGREQDAAAALQTLNRHLTAYRSLEARMAFLADQSARPDPPVLRLAEVQREVLDDDAVLLRLVLGDRQSYAWAVTRRSMRVVELPAKAAVEMAARPVIDLNAGGPSSGAADRRERFHRAAAGLSAMLLDPLARDLANRRLLIVGDGLLQLVPFAALPEPRLGDPLIVRHEIVLLPSASSLAAVRRHARARPPPAKTVAVLADAVYESDDPRLPASRTGAAATGGPDVDRPAVGRLPLTKAEARSILNLVPPAQRFAALGFDANTETATRADLGGYRIVHFGAHAQMDDGRPELSSILLSFYDEAGRPRNGRLRTMDVSRMALSADLVVLSACETVAGRDVPGEGLMGIARAFFGAGARAVIGSLTRVQESGTEQLMTALYQELLGPHKRSPAAALRAAQLAMLAEPSTADPILWSPFVVMGDSR